MRPDTGCVILSYLFMFCSIITHELYELTYQISHVVIPGILEIYINKTTQVWSGFQWEKKQIKYVIYLKSCKRAWNIVFPSLRINISYILSCRYIRSETGVQQSMFSSYRFEANWAASISTDVQWAGASRYDDNRAEYI